MSCYNEMVPKDIGEIKICPTWADRLDRWLVDLADGLRWAMGR